MKAHLQVAALHRIIAPTHTHTRHTAQTARQLYGPGQARPEGIEHNLGRAARLVRPYVGTLEPRGRLWRPMFTG